MVRHLLATLLFVRCLGVGDIVAAQAPERALPRAGLDRRIAYRLLATTKTSTLERELNQAAQEGFRFEGVMGGETAFGGKESVVIRSRTADAEVTYEYKLLATNKTSTLARELADAGRKGFEVRGKTIFETTFGGKE